jgi:lipid-A-disaccharide synthase
MKIFVSAAEISSDIHAEKIISSLVSKYQKQFPSQTIELVGIGGPRLRSMAGFRCIEPAESLRAMGFVEVVGKLTHIRSVLSRAVDEIAKFQPDLIMTFDYPDFHLRLMRTLKKKKICEKSLKICGIPPKVWVWRSKRVEKIRELYDGVWVIFPFEKKFYESKGIPVIYEGNPLIGDLFERPRNPMGVHGGFADGLMLAVMPGSREAELKYHLPVIQPTLDLFSKRIGKKVHALIPVPVGVSFEAAKKILLSSAQVEYHFIENGTLDVLANTNFGLIKSGTSTLEAAVLGCVPVIFYKVNGLTELIYRAVSRYAGPVGLPNILLGVRDRKHSIFPELLGADANPKEIAEALVALAVNPQLLEEKKHCGMRLKEALVPHHDIALAVAEKVMAWMKVRPYCEPRHRRSVFILIGSFIWSSLNYFRRALYRAGWFHSVTPQAHSILVGNLQAGGSGKTPIVKAIVSEALRAGRRVAVVSRGYGSAAEQQFKIVLSDETTTAHEIGDEPAEIKKSFPKVILGVGSDRRKVLKHLPQVDLIVFDDGFQNLKFAAHRTVLCMTDRTRSEFLYRDFDSQKRHVDLVLHPQELEWNVTTLPSTPIWLLCAVGDPQAVVRFYTQREVEIQRVISKPDHAWFTEAEISNWVAEAERAGCQLAVTEKDRAKISDKFSTLFVLKRELRTTDWIQTLF